MIKIMFLATIVPAVLFMAGATKAIISEVLDKNRRAEHPEYFNYYDAGIKITDDIHEQATYKKTYFEQKLKLIYDGLRDGECTVKYFRNHTNSINEEYIEFAEWFEAKRKEANELFKKADLYAKEHNLLWGVLY